MLEPASVRGDRRIVAILEGLTAAEREMLGSLTIQDLFVLEQYRGCGIGKAMLKRLAQIATERGWAEWNGQCSTGTPARKISTARKARAQWMTGRCGV
jgi:GNAT superfamily N-acetyltransferase